MESQITTVAPQIYTANTNTISFTTYTHEVSNSQVSYGHGKLIVGFPGKFFGKKQEARGISFFIFIYFVLKIN